MLKRYETVSDANITSIRFPQLEKKNVATNRNYVLRKMDLKFENPNFSNLCKIAF